MSVSFNNAFKCFRSKSVIGIIPESIVDRPQTMHPLLQLRFRSVLSWASSIHALISSLQYSCGNSLFEGLASSLHIPLHWLVSIDCCSLCHIELCCARCFLRCSWHKLPSFVVASFSHWPPPTWPFDARIYMNWHHPILNNFFHCIQQMDPK